MDKPPPVAGAVATVRYLDDLRRAVALYRDELGLEPMSGDAARLQPFDEGGRHVLLLFNRGSRRAEL
jgi:hypothetical protein